MARSCDCPPRSRRLTPPLSASMKRAAAAYASVIRRSMKGIDVETARALARDLAREGKLTEDGTLKPPRRKRHAGR